MKIEFTKKQYRELIKLVLIGNSVVSLLGDMTEGTDYKKQSNKLEKVEKYLLQFADDFDCEDIADDDAYEKNIWPIVSDYDDFILYNSLAHTLAWKDFRKKYSKEEIEKMAKKNGGYFGVALYDFEKKYWDEFDKHGFERLGVKEGK